MLESHVRSAYRVTALRLLLMLLPTVWSLHHATGAMATDVLVPNKGNMSEQHNNTVTTGAKSGGSSSSDDNANADHEDSFLTNIYGPWSAWRSCNKKCQQTRKRKCIKERQCGKSYMKEKRSCELTSKCMTRAKKRMKLIGLRKNGKFVTQILYKILYGAWTPWSGCSRSCRKERRRNCVQSEMCGDSYLLEERPCMRPVCRKQYILRRESPETEISDIIKKINNTSGASLMPSSGRQGISKSKPSFLGECGIRSQAKSRSLRVVGGRQSRKHAWPWQVAILEKWQEQFCGGTLIAPQWVLTAAHCVRKKKKPRKIFVRVGDHDIYATDSGEIKLKLEKDFPHPRYNFDTITNDIALLKLEYPVNRSDTIDFACLPEKKDKLEEKRTNCYIVGWGKEKNSDLYGSTVLREAEVPLVDRRTCQKAFEYVIHNTQICAGNRKGGTDSCAGDSGGPLLCRKTDSNGNKRWVVYGITSYGEGCGEKQKYGIYTNVKKYLDWINNIITTN